LVSSTQTPVKKFIEVGLTNDNDSEIVSGLNEGDLVISKVVSSTTASKTTTSLFGNRTTGASSGSAGRTSGGIPGVPH
jgi:hypothetical protein